MSLIDEIINLLFSAGLLFLVIGNAVGLVLPRIIFMFIDIGGNWEKNENLMENKADDKNMYFILAAKYLRVHYMVLFGLFCFVATSYGIRHYCMHTAGIFMVVLSLKKDFIIFKVNHGNMRQL